MQDDLPPLHLSGNLDGAIDRFVAPRLLSGWVKNSALIGNGLDITLFVYRDDRLVAKGQPTRARPDIVRDANYLTEFALYCTEDIPDELIAFDLLRIEARDNDGRFSRLPIWDVVRGIAFVNLMQTATPLGKSATAAVLHALGQNRGLPEDTRQAILQVHDLHFLEENRRLMYQFESLGKDCSLGSVQRAFGAEPLGLLRFSGIGAKAVVAALQSRFRGVGLPEFTRLEPSGTGEYYSRDTRYHMLSHTFVYENDVEFEHFYQQQCKKITFLTRNILEKLEDGEKIFVIHAIPDVIPDETLLELLSAMRSIGQSPLLYLEVATKSCPPGTLVMRDDGIMVGYVLQIQGDLISPVAEVRKTWLTVCQKAEAMVRDQARTETLRHTA